MTDSGRVIRVRKNHTATTPKPPPRAPTPKRRTGAERAMLKSMYVNCGNGFMANRVKLIGLEYDHEYLSECPICGGSNIDNNRSEYRGNYHNYIYCRECNFCRLGDTDTVPRKYLHRVPEGVTVETHFLITWSCGTYVFNPESEDSGYAPEFMDVMRRPLPRKPAK